MVVIILVVKWLVIQNRYCTSGRHRRFLRERQISKTLSCSVWVLSKSWCNRRSALVLTSPWRSGPARPAFASLTATLNDAGPLLLQRTGDIQDLTYRLHIIPHDSPHDLARSRMAPVAQAMSLSYDASGHKLSVEFNRVPFDIIVLKLHCLCPRSRKKLGISGLSADNVLPACLNSVPYRLYTQ